MARLSEEFMAHMGGGRPSKLTPELSARFIEAYKRTGYLRSASLSVGVHPGTVLLWLAKGRKTKSGPYFDFHDAVTRATGERISALETAHGSLALGGQIVRKPKRKVIIDDKNRVTVTTEIEFDADGKPIWEQHWEELSPEARVRAQEWELRYRDRETYSDDDAKGNEAGDGRVSIVLVQQFLKQVDDARAARAAEPVETTAKPVEALPAPAPSEPREISADVLERARLLIGAEGGSE